MNPAQDRREKLRFVLPCTIHVRSSAKGSAARWSAGKVRDISSSGICFHSRRTLAAGEHLEVVVDWPVTRDDLRPVTLRTSGFVVRSTGNKVALRIASSHFHIAARPAATLLEAIA